MELKFFTFLVAVFFINFELASSRKKKPSCIGFPTSQSLPQTQPIFKKKPDVAITIRESIRKRKEYKKEAQRRERQDLLLLLVSMLGICVLADYVPLEKYDPMFLS